MSSSTFSESELLANFSGDEEILIDLIDIFLMQGPGLLEKVEMAIKENNSKELTITAHTLKGVVSNFYAKEICLLCQELENQGKSSQLENSLKNFEELKLKITPFLAEITVFKESLLNV